LDAFGLCVSHSGQLIADEEEFGATRPVEEANVGDYVIVNSSNCDFGYPFWVAKITHMDPSNQQARDSTF
jgi:hypothetical protein